VESVIAFGKVITRSSRTRLSPTDYNTALRLKPDLVQARSASSALAALRRHDAALSACEAIRGAPAIPGGGDCAPLVLELERPGELAAAEAAIAVGGAEAQAAAAARYGARPARRGARGGHARRGWRLGMTIAKASPISVLPSVISSALAGIRASARSARRAAARRCARSAEMGGEDSRRRLLVPTEQGVGTRCNSSATSVVSPRAVRNPRRRAASLLNLMGSLDAAVEWTDFVKQDGVFDLYVDLLSSPVSWDTARHHPRGVPYPR
jgi:hypothetical protein